MAQGSYLSMSFLARLRFVNSLVFSIASARSVPRRDSDQAADSWLSQFCHEQGISQALLEVLVEHQITTESVFAGIIERDLADMHFVVAGVLK